MVHDADAVGGYMNIELDCVESEIHRSLERIDRVLGENVMSPAVRYELHHVALDGAVPPVNPCTNRS